jgi:HEAT repeat protein
MKRLLALGLCLIVAYVSSIWYALTHPTEICQLVSATDPAAQLLAKYDPENPKTWERLACERKLQHRNPAVRIEAANKLGELGTEGRPAVPALLDALNDDDWGVVDAAVSALKRIDPIAAKNAGLN